MRTCEACGGGTDEAAKRCPRCGAALAPATEAGPSGNPGPPGEPAGDAAAPGSRTAEPPAPPPVEARLSPATVEVEPGGIGEAVLEVAGVAAVDDRVTIEVIGDAAPWTEVEPIAIDLAAGATAVAAVRVRPPLDAGPVGASIDVGFVVRSAGRPNAAAAVELAVVELRQPVAPAVAAEPGAEPPAGQPAPAAGRSGPPARALAAIGVVAVALAVVAGAAVLGGTRPAPGSTPAAVATPVGPTAAPASSTPTATPVPTPTPAPATPTPGPDAPAAWWQDAWDAAALQGAALGALVAEGTTDDGLPFATFADGAVYQRVTGAFSMSGPIWQAWVERGGGAGPAPGLGYPASPALGSDPDRRQLFDDGAIYWTAATGAHAVHGEVWAWWRQLVRDRGGDVELPGDSGLVEPLGPPVADVRADAGGTWVDLEAGRIGVRTDGTRWACSTATPPAAFPACSVVDPRP